MRLVYLGTPEMAVPPLEALVAAGHDVLLVVTRTDKRRGRGGGVSPSPVKAAAQRLGLPVSHSVADVIGCGAELGVVVAFGQIVKPDVLASVPMVNLHFSLLPRWRGAAPVERALLAGDATTGVCVMELAEGLDTGDVYASVELPIGAHETAAELRARLVAAGTELLLSTLAEALPRPVPQRGDPLYAAKITQDDLHIDWSSDPALIDRQIRVGGAWTTFRGSRFKIHEAELAGGRIVPLVVQPEGKPRMAYAAWRNGAQPAPGEWFE